MALERIAIALEVQSGLARPEDAGVDDTSAVLYIDDVEEAKKEWRREAYTARTGIDLPEGEEPPAHGPKDEDWPSG
jgi:hypothetical protein